MNFLDLVQSRRSIRHYAPHDVEPEKIDYLLECARLAPSACNRQPWQIQVVRTPEHRTAVAEAAARFGWLQEAPLLLVVTVDDQEAWTRSSDGHNHSDVDAAILTEHLVLAATEQGLGCCWVCAFDPEKCRSALQLPATLRPVAILPIGYPAEEPTSRTRKPMEEITKNY